MVPTSKGSKNNKKEKTMRTQYTKDKTARLSFRVNESLYGWVSNRASKLGVSPCEYARSLLFQQMALEEALRSTDAPVADNARVKTCGKLKKQ